MTKLELTRFAVMQLHLSLILLQLLVRRRSRTDPAISGNTVECIIYIYIYVVFYIYIKI